MVVHIPGPSPQRFRGLVDTFLEELRAQGKSAHTIRAYGWHLYRFTRWLEGQGILETSHWGEPEALRYLSTLWDVFQPSTIKQSVAAIRAWVRWLRHKGFIKEDFSRYLPVPKVEPSPQRTLSLEEIRRLFSVCPQNIPRGARDLALMALLLETGLRAGEIVRLRLSDWDEKRRTFRVRGKGGRIDLVKCSPECTHYLRNWLRFREDVAEPDVQHFFVSVGGLTRGRPLTTRGLRIILKKIGDQAGVPGVHPHAFRRSFAVILVKNGVPTRTLQVVGRWKDLDMVERYTQVLTAVDTWDEIAGKTPLATLKQ